MAKSKEYWEKRFTMLEDSQTRRSVQYFAELEKQYRKAAIVVQKDIERWYARLEANNELTMQGVRKLLTRNELEEFKWDVMDYIEKGKTLNVSDRWMKELENASARFHISRLEAIKLQIQNHVEVLYGTEYDEVSAHMEKIYTDGYYHTAFEIQKGFAIGYDLMKLDADKIEKVLSKPWAADGSNFSDRIWTHKAQLVSELHNGLTQAIIRGQHPHKVTEMIAKRFDVSKGKAGRLVMTESAFFNSASNHDCMKDLGVERYEICSTLDKKTSDICRQLDGKVFDMKDYQVGATAPPFHVWCRTTTVPYFDDEFELDTQRAARDEEGKTYYVPANMKYEDWKKSFVDGGSKDDLTPIVKADDSERVRLDAQKNQKSTSQEKATDEVKTSANDDVFNGNSDIAEYKIKKKEYDDSVRKLDELDKEVDKLQDEYMLEIGTDRAEELNKKFEAKFVEVEEYKKYVEELKQNLSPYESKAIKVVESELSKLVNVNADKINLKGLPYESAEIWYRKTSNVLQKFPQIKENITLIKYDPSITKLTDAGTKPLKGEIYIGKPFSDYKKMLKDYAEDVLNGYSPRGTNASSVITHEFGHLLDGYLTKSKKAGLINQYGVKYASEELVNDVLKDMNITTKEGIFKDIPFKERLEVREKWIAENISKYASKDNKETFAELFAEYVDSPKPRPVAKELGKRVEKLLGNDVTEEVLENTGKSGTMEVEIDTPTLNGYDEASKIFAEKRKLESEYDEVEVTRMNEHLNNLIQNNDFCIRINEDDTTNILDSIVKDGRFKTQMETNTSGGALAPTLRKTASSNLFGHNGVNDSEYEIYGYLGSKDKSKDLSAIPLSPYGDGIVTLKKDTMFNRTTLTVGDSLSDGKDGFLMGSKVNSIDAAICDSRLSLIHEHNDTIERCIAEKGVDDVSNIGYSVRGYFELQYHGKVRIEDIESITLDKYVWDSKSDELIETLRENGIAVQYVDGEQVIIYERG